MSGKHHAGGTVTIQYVWPFPKQIRRYLAIMQARITLGISDIAHRKGPPLHAAWRVSRVARADFVLDALVQALHERRPFDGRLVHHSDRGAHYVSIRYTERLAETDIEPSVGSVGDAYDNVLAETINSLYKTEVIHRRGPWRCCEAVEFATLEWVD